MDKGEVRKIEEEMSEFLVDGKITLLTKLKWLQLKGAIRITNEDHNVFSVVMTNEGRIPFTEYQKKMDNFFYWRDKYNAGKMKTNDIETTKQ